MAPALELDGRSLTLEAVESVARGGRPVRLAAAAAEAVDRARAVVETAARSDAVIYGVNTGLGRLSDIRIPADRILELQCNLLRSHACGVGPLLSAPVTRAMMVLRANSLAKGHSGVRRVVIEGLCELLNAGITPQVPSQGSVGASGDLAPLAHLALVLIGEGKARAWSPSGDVGPPLSGAEALRAAGLAPLRLEAKEGLSLLNGTQAMLAVGALSLLDAERLMDCADVVGALSVEALRGTPVAFDGRLQALRPHPGQAVSAAHLRHLMEGSEIRESHRECGRVQDAYSLRCIPQVHGAARDALAEARRIFAIEANAAVDNPLVVWDENGAAEILSGGNFHGEPLAFALDQMAIALTAVSGISERRLERLVNPALNEGLPAFLAAEPGLHSGLMMAQVTAAALVAENRGLAYPASVGSITTSGNKEDFVSMGMGGALKLQSVLANTRQVLGIEAIAAAEALEYLLPLRPGVRLRSAQARIRECVPRLQQDRVLAEDFARAAELVGGEKLAGI